MQSVEAAVFLQKYARRFVCRSRFKRLRCGVVRLQAVIRGLLLRRRVRQWHASATKIQHRYRGYKHARQQRQTFINYKKAAKLLQYEWRRWKMRQGVEYLL